MFDQHVLITNLPPSKLPHGMHTMPKANLESVQMLTFFLSLCSNACVRATSLGFCGKTLDITNLDAHTLTCTFHCKQSYFCLYIAPSVASVSGCPFNPVSWNKLLPWFVASHVLECFPLWWPAETQQDQQQSWFWGQCHPSGFEGNAIKLLKACTGSSLLPWELCWNSQGSILSLVSE